MNLFGKTGKANLLALLVIGTLATPTFAAGGRGQVRARITAEVVEKMRGKILEELSKTELSKTIEEVLSAGQLKLLIEKAEELISAKVESDPEKAVTLTAKLMAASKNDSFPEAKEAIRSAKALRETGDPAKVTLARAAYEFAANASASGLTARSSRTAQQDSPAEVVFATLEAIRLSPSFEGAGVKPLTQVIERINAEYNAQGNGSKSIETAADRAVTKEKRKEFVENCKK